MGVPFNIEFYALLTHMIADQKNFALGNFIWSGGDCHIYSNHEEGVLEQLQQPIHGFPQLKIKRKAESLFDYKPEDFELVDYKHGPVINYPVAV